MKYIKSLLLALMSILQIQVYSQEFEEVLKAVSPDREENKHFGSEVEIYGNYAVEGSFYEDKDANEENPVYFAGAAYIYERDINGKWQFKQKITASDRDSTDYFGAAAALFNNYLVIGAPREDDDATGENKIKDAGSIYVFRRQIDGKWIEMQKLVASDRDSLDYFGSTVAICGKYIVAGAPHDEDDANGENEFSQAGSAYIFELDKSGTWHEVQKIVGSERGKSFEFGSSVSIDKEIIVVGVYGEDFEELNSAGAVYVYEKNLTGTWVEKTRLVPDVRGYYELFGFSVDISGDYVIVGTPDDNENELDADSLYRSGSASIFERHADGNWYFVQKLVAPVRADKDYLGQDVSISGNYAIAGAIGEDENELEEDSIDWAGAVFLFKRNTEGLWELIQKIVPDDRAEEDYIGENICISNDYILIGADWQDKDELGGNELSNAGALYFYEACKAESTSDPDNILENGDFESCNLAPWWIYTSVEQDQPATFIIDNGMCGIFPQDVTSAPEPWHIQFMQQFSAVQEAKINPGSVYELTFDARAGVKDRSCLLFFGLDEEPYTDILYHTILLDTVMKSYAVEIPVSTELSSVKLGFYLGAEMSPVWLDNIRLVYERENLLSETAGQNIRVFPNPTEKNLHVSTNCPVLIELYSSLGHLIYTQTLPQGESVISLHDLPGGVYYVHISNDQGSTAHKVIHY
jgi:hypothetical protein